VIRVDSNGAPGLRQQHADGDFEIGCREAEKKGF